MAQVIHVAKVEFIKVGPCHIRGEQGMEYNLSFITKRKTQAAAPKTL